MTIQLARNALSAYSTRIDHCGLKLRRGLNIAKEAHESNNKDSSFAKDKLIADIAATTAPRLYLRAFERWKQALASDPQRFVTCELTLETRLYIGLTRDNPLETGITTHHCYGMPLIPGSAIKGVMRSFAAQSRLDDVVTTYLFGSDFGSKAVESSALIVHDAWWVPNGAPFAAEVITPHHTEYYGSEGKVPASDFDSPIPAPQIAAQGSFLFALECLDASWRGLAVTLLKTALRRHGIGSKTTSGYGYFSSPAIGGKT